MTATLTCIADDDGRPCHRSATATQPVALCQPHRIEIALTVAPELLRDALATALQDSATVPAARNELVATATAATAADLLQGVHGSVVYFIANGGRVKIGYTTNLKNRLSSLALRAEAVLLVLHGGPDLERALHARFAQHRNGNTEWFELAPEILRYIAALHPAMDPAGVRRNGVPPRGYDAHVTAQSAQRAQGVAKVTELLAQDPGLTSGQVAEALDVSPATAKRYLREARNGGQ